ncbi:transposase InsO family protein [Geodermatophilus bullaregiensis]|uniref:IS481 family transposase n=1 Tax=Geodermatophilus bullaregiensis TaxID=1564160 RepID=UPI001958DE20|nr:IS481 family transposase [Geodermatophilus bullaregiensis]MBM7806191.1 transposase InsO family protein [Geodermatophilus bullaregiensis]
MAHANARTTVYARKLIVDRVGAGHRPGEVAKQLRVSRQTVDKWLRRYRAEGEAGLADRSSRPHRMPRQTSPETTAAIVAARTEHHAGPVRLAAILGLAASTIGAVLARAGRPRLAEVDRLTGELLRGRRHSDRRYERAHPGVLLHIDVNKLGRIPAGGGWRVHGRSEEVRGRGLGWDYVHVAVDEHTRLAYAEVLSDQRVVTCAGFLTRAAAWFAARGVIVRRVLTDNAKSYRVGRAWIAVCAQLGIGRRFIKPGRPATFGNAERFNRTLQTEWAYATAWTSNDERTAALDSWLEHYNTARSHSALGGHPPVSRLAA